MLKKTFRFHGHNSLNFVHSKGRSVRSSCLQLKYLKNNRRTEGRLAVVVSKKIAKQAPLRNRIRRRIFENMRLHWSMITPGHDLVITVFDSRIAEEPHAKLNKIIVELLYSAGIYRV